MMRKHVLLCAILLSLAAPQIFASLSPVASLPATFGSGQATVTSTVEYDNVANLFRYTYTVSNATEKFTSFMVAIDPSISIVSSGILSSLVSSWVVTDDNDAMVATITGNLKTSGATATVWFTCAQDYTTGDGALANVKTYAQGSVLSPIPEPMTMLLLGSGWVLLRRYKSKK
jgi:hypothetical protein